MRFTTVAASDEDIRGTTDAPGKSQVLTRADLDVLCDEHSWLTDALINYGVEECDAWGPPLGKLSKGVLWIQPALVRAGMEGDFDETLGRALGWNGGVTRPKLDADDELVDQASVILLPVNNGNTHWSLLAFYKEGPTWVHYDSLNQANDAAARALVAKLLEKGYLAKLPTIVDEKAVVRQEDSYNCGAYVIQNARLIMSLGAQPEDDQVEAITSHTAEETRLAMQLALVPLIAQAPPVVGLWWEHDERGKSESRPVVMDKEARKAALEKVHEALQTENEIPISISSVQKCDKAEKSTYVVVIASSNDEDYAAEGGSVTFTVEGEQFTRPLSWDGKRWMTTLTTQFPKAVTVAVSAKIHPPAEFSDKVKTEEVAELGVGAKKEVTLKFEPRKPRRLHLKFLVDDETENKDIKDEDKRIRRPFPKDTQIEILLDDGPSKATGTIQADGTVNDDSDGNPGVKVPWSYNGGTPQFPEHKAKRWLAWTEGSESGSATVFLDDKEKKDKTQRLGFSLPTGVWIPVRRAENWKFAAAHYDSKKQLVKNLDLSKVAEPPGDPEKPIEYILKSQPAPFLMNGHLIEHVVCLMLENRGFDHFMGYLYEGSVQPKHNYPPPSQAKGQHAGLRRFEGLEGLEPTCPYYYNYTTKHKNYLRQVVTTEHTAEGVAKCRKGATSSNIPTTNPHEDFIHIFQDMYGPEVIPDPHDMEDKTKREKAVKKNGEYIVPKMNGWAQNFCDGIRHHRSETTTILTNRMVDEIMQMYIPDQLPVMHGLARNYAVSDLWFCSVPSQTNTNRAFWASGHAAGICKNDFRPAIRSGYASDAMPEGTDQNDIEFRRSLFDVLDENGHSWKYYHTVPYPPALRYNDNWKALKNYYYFTSMFPQFKKSPNVTSLDKFYEAAANGNLPRVAYIEPLWGGGKKWDAISPLDRAVGNEFHPVQDMFCGEFFVKKVYDAIVKGPKRDSTLLIITFDENGGTYDHFPPWKAVPPNRAGNLKDGEEFGFSFDCYGVRVPTLLISKYIKSETIFRSPTEVPYDHTSVISTVLKWLGVPKQEWRLGDRVDQAPTFDGALLGDGEEEEKRRKTATGVAHFNGAREKATSGRKPINYGDTFVLKYVGNKWGYEEQGRPDYIAQPISSMKWWYPTVSRTSTNAIVFKFSGGEGEVKAGSKVVIMATGKTTKNKSMENYSLALPETPGAQKIYLYTGSKPSLWIPWLVNDRNYDIPLFYGDEVFLFSERYLPERLANPVAGVGLVDPYKRLHVDPYNSSAPNARRYVSWRAGEWDIWVLERV